MTHLLMIIVMVMIVVMMMIVVMVIEVFAAKRVSEHLLNTGGGCYDDEKSHCSRCNGAITQEFPK